MSKGREIRCYDYVNYPYVKVRDVLTEDALAVFQSATKGAASRAGSIASELHASLGGIEVTKEIAISVTNIEEDDRATPSSPATRLHLEWEAAKTPRLFPLMKAELSVYALTGTETQLDFAGIYEPPVGALGGVIDSIVGHRIAEVSVHRFVADVAAFLRTTLG